MSTKCHVKATGREYRTDRNRDYEGWWHCTVLSMDVCEWGRRERRGRTVMTGGKGEDQRRNIGD